jgi:gamma-glutamyl hercynylcysteine S-oxide synthase
MLLAMGRFVVYCILLLCALPCFGQFDYTRFSIEINRQKHQAKSDSGVLNQQLRFSMQPMAHTNEHIITLQNISTDTLEIRNYLPLSSDRSEAYITGLGEHGLSRTHLFSPGKIPVNIICPDNAWEMGVNCFVMQDGSKSVYLARRDRNSILRGQRRRFETILFPGGSVSYRQYHHAYEGSWQEGLRIICQQKYLYDLPSFDNTLFERKDLQWMRHSYVMHLMQAWDKFFYDATDKQYHLAEFIQRGKKLYGGDEVIGIWPTWPSLGLDQRNQFDLFRDLPGGTPKLKELSAQMRKSGTRFFVCYNPWDESTRSEGHLAGLGNLVKATDADGVVLDTRGASSKELQEAADKVRPGVVMYSEGMAVPKDMPGIVSGRVHNALYYPPMFNLNKFIKPEFAIFRVAELYKEPIRREFATSFFNGYGTEINMFAPGQPGWTEEQYKYLGRTSRILRENTHNFVSGVYTPLLVTTSDSIWVNEWKNNDKIIYTIYSIIPGGYRGQLFNVQPKDGYHFVDLWHHKLLTPQGPVRQEGWDPGRQQKSTQIYSVYHIEAETDAFASKWLGTNNEGEVDCIARLPILISAARNGDKLKVSARRGKTIKIWAGHPSYDKLPFETGISPREISLQETFGRFEGDFVVQLFDDGILLDETIVSLPAGEPRMVSNTNDRNAIKAKTSAAAVPDGMVVIPSGQFTFKESHGDEFIAYPKQYVDSSFDMPSFYMDKHPVTNLQFKKFMDATRYRPIDTVNFLRHWISGRIKKGEEQFPVVYVSYEDAKAYAKWAGKNLPTEIEWQYAAQTPALNEWPWKQAVPVKRKEEVVTETLTVTSIEGIDSSLCNLGNGQLYPVGKYPQGANPYGLQDLVGCVWQLTNDVYMSGSYRYILLKGGSYFKPSSSWWYVQSGPRELHYRQFLLRVSPGFERNGTVGFRCMKSK